MPLMECEIDGQKGWKYGDSGKCYPGEEGKKKAIAQGVAIGGGKLPEQTQFSMKGYALIEASYSPDVRVDRENSVIRDVKILGRESRNNRTYSEAAMDQAARLYEGMDVNLDHPDGKPDTPRKMAEGFGVLRGITKKSDGVYGDLHYLKAHPLAETISEYAERFPKNFGLSHVAEGSVAIKDGKQLVETIERVRSVDIVRSPATNVGLFEDVQPMTLSEVIKLVEPTEFLTKQVLEAAVAQYPQMAAMPMPAIQPGQGQPDQITAAIKGLLVALVDTGAIPAKTILELLKGHLMPDESQNQQSASETKAKTPPVDEQAKDSVNQTLTQLSEQLGSLTKRELARDLLEQAEIHNRPDLLKQLLEEKDEEAMKAKLASWPPSVLRKTRPIFESRVTSAEMELPKDRSEFLARIN